VNEMNYKRFDDFLKAGTIILAVVIGFFLGKASTSDKTVAAGNTVSTVTSSLQPGLVGQHFSLPGIDWAQSQQTLVMALQTTCRFCSDSGPFYQELIRDRAKFARTRIVAVLPQVVEESKAYLGRLGVSVDDIRQGALAEIGVRGTPTLLLVNSAGVVTDVWAGKLQPTVEKEVLDRLHNK
jgi:hypothetical protein